MDLFRIFNFHSLDVLNTLFNLFSKMNCAEFWIMMRNFSSFFFKEIILTLYFDAPCISAINFFDNYIIFIIFLLFLVYFNQLYCINC